VSPVVTVPSRPTAPSGSVASTFACIRQHESGGNYANADTGHNGHYGAYQYSPTTWNYSAKSAGYGQYANGRADLAPPAVQDAVSIWLQATHGWSAWYGDGCVR
jgi:hypothetical protein